MFLLATSVVAEGKPGSLGCSKGDSGATPPFPFEVGDGNDYGQRRLELTLASKCQCDDNDCIPCAIVVGYHGYSESGTTNHSWKNRLEPKGEAVGFISLYPTGDLTESNYFNWAALKSAAADCVETGQYLHARILETDAYWWMVSPAIGAAPILKTMLFQPRGK